MATLGSATRALGARKHRQEILASRVEPALPQLVAIGEAVPARRQQDTSHHDDLTFCIHVQLKLTVTVM